MGGLFNGPPKLPLRDPSSAPQDTASGGPDWRQPGRQSTVLAMAQPPDSETPAPLPPPALPATDAYEIAQNENGGGRSSTGSDKTFSGYATFYDLPGNKTASGAIFDSTINAAAMFRKEGIKLGDTVRVHLQSDPTRFIDVKVNDTGRFLRDARGKPVVPYQPHPDRIIDLTPKAFKELTGDLKIGKVKVFVTKKPDEAK